MEIDWESIVRTRPRLTAREPTSYELRESAGSYTRGIPDNKGEAFEDDRRRVKGGLDLDSHHVSY